MKKIVKVMAVLAAVGMLAVGASASKKVNAIVDFDKSTITLVNVDAVAAGAEQSYPLQYYVSGPTGAKFFGPAGNGKLPDGSQYGAGWNPAIGAVESAGVVLGGDDGVAAGTMLQTQEFEGVTLENFKEIKIVVNTAEGQETELNEIIYLPDVTTTTETTTVTTASATEGETAPPVETTAATTPIVNQPDTGVVFAIIPAVVAAGAAVVASRKRK